MRPTDFAFFLTSTESGDVWLKVHCIFLNHYKVAAEIALVEYQKMCVSV